jgi:hypothetical protein
MTPRTLALVESPAQLLNVLEWALGDRAGGADRPVDVAVLLPQDDATRRQLAAMADLARTAGLRVSVHDIRGGPAALAGCGTRLAPKLAAASRLVLGDPFSRLIQLLLPLSPAKDLVLVDDGTATIGLASALSEGRPLVRWHRRAPDGSPATGSAAAARATRRLTARAGHGVELFTSMAGPLPVPPGTRCTANRYTWARQRFGAPVLLPLVDLAGSSLVETGLIDRDRYIEGVARLARQYGVCRYLAHRREDPEKLRLLAAAAEVEIVRPQLPLELAVLDEPVGATLLSFPSTVLHTLPIVLRGYGVHVAACEEIHAWLGPDTPAQVSAFLQQVSATAADVLATTRPTPSGGQEAALT